MPVQLITSGLLCGRSVKTSGEKVILFSYTSNIIPEDKDASINFRHFPWFIPFNVGLSTRRSRFNSRPVRVGFAVDIVACKRFFVQHLVFPYQYRSISIPHPFMYLGRYSIIAIDKILNWHTISIYFLKSYTHCNNFCFLLWRWTP
jgi:hypothetical protein